MEKQSKKSQKEECLSQSEECAHRALQKETEQRRQRLNKNEGKVKLPEKCNFPVTSSPSQLALSQ